MGVRIVQASWAGTAAFAGTAAGAALAPGTLEVVALAVSLLLFVLGVGTFAWAFLVAVGRSRTEEIGLAGLFGLAGSAPRRVQGQLLGSLAVEVVVALATAGLRPYTALAFGVLAPLFGIGLAGLWGARHGTFPARADSRIPRPGGRR